MIKPEEGHSLLRGRNVVIDCQTDGYPQPTHQWKKVKNGIKPFDHSGRELVGIVSGPHIQVLENGSISIVGITKEDDGVYICESSNNVGPPLSVTTRLTINQPVRFNKNFELIEANRGDPVILVCTVFGDAPITLSWIRDREAVLPMTGPGNNNIKIEEERTEDSLTSKVILSSVDVTDSAFFTCQARNAFGADEKNVQLVVRGPPEPPTGLKVGEIKSRAASLSWLPTVNGNSPLLGYIVEYTTSNGTKCNYSSHQQNPHHLTNCYYHQFSFPSSLQFLFLPMNKPHQSNSMLCNFCLSIHLLILFTYKCLLIC